MDNLIAVEESVLTILDKETGEPVAVIRKNGSIKWYLIKGEPTWEDYRSMLNVLVAKKT